ncbi:MAG TPA: hypothetical protein PKK06_04365 [Phycisphaerae bacterium]|nr:hypothetical protein [Phycisphaerae bacterium]HNU46177.1 hypothetical protein [Phycisphaerae bacterium]
MSQIPSDIAASAIQAGYHAKDTAEARDARAAARTHADPAQPNKVGEAGEIVETDDRDAEVYADAEGTGSQGRSFSTPEAQSEEESPQESTPGITTDADGHLRVDLEA